MSAKIKKPRGRPKADPEAKRGLSLPPIAVNEIERVRIEARAQAAGIPVSTWVRYAAQEIDPPTRRAIPPLNQAAWLQLGEELHALRGLKWRLEVDGERVVL